MHLWPDKEGQSQAQKEDVLRKTLQTHVKHIAEKMQAAREEEKGHVRDLNEVADEIIRLCQDNATDARKYAQKTKKPQDFMFSSNAASHVLNFISKLKPESEKTKSGLDEMRESIRKQRNDMADSTGRLQSG